MIRRARATQGGISHSHGTLIPVLFGFLLTLSMACSESKDDSAKDKLGAKAKAANEAPGLQGKVDPSYLPIDILAELAPVEFKTAPHCSLTIATLSAALADLAQAREKLASTTQKSAAMAILRQASTDLSKHATKIETVKEGEEIQRIAAELSASMKDLAEGLLEAGKTMANDDEAGSDSNMRRLRNGVKNTAASVASLVRQCVP